MNTATSIQTFTGLFFDPFDPDPNDIRIEDIAHALTMQCRFSGHVRRRWSVAQHSMMVSDLCPTGLMLHGLLHDASEAYLVDLPRPLKRAPGMEKYREVEEQVEAAIALRFGLSIGPMPKEVKRADNILLWAEADALLHGTREWRDDLPEDLDRDQFSQLVTAIRSSFPPSDEYIRDEFIQTFYALGGK